MTLLIESELETQLRDIAQKLGTDTDSYAQDALRRQIHLDSSRITADFDAEMQMAANDPLFLADINEIEQAFASADAETARRLDHV